MHKQLKITSIYRIDRESKSKSGMLQITGKTDSELDSSLVTELIMYAYADNIDSVFADYLQEDEVALVIDEHGAKLHFENNECKTEIDSIAKSPVSEPVIISYPIYIRENDDVWKGPYYHGDPPYYYNPAWTLDPNSLSVTTDPTYWEGTSDLSHTETEIE